MTKRQVNKETPLMKQYNTIKEKYPGAMLLFRVGDFYETFGEDAIKASKVLDIVLTKRSNGAASEMELAGFPYHSLDVYLPKLVRAGFRVAICDQLEDPKATKGIVKRGVTELVTPGLSFNENVLQQKQNNYLASIHFSKNNWGVALLDISTGEFLVAEGSEEYVDKLVQSFLPSELIYCKKHQNIYEQHFDKQFSSFRLEDWVYSFDFGYEALCNHFQTQTLKGFGIEQLHDAIIAAGAILHYLESTEHKNVQHIGAISRIEEENYVWLDRFTIRNLELIYAQHEEGVSLLSTLDQTVTPMGGRLIKKWTVLPLKEKAAIEARQNIVESFYNDSTISETVLSHLKNIADLERLISKVAARRINPREMLQLNKSLKSILPIKTSLSSTEAPLQKFADQLISCNALLEKIDIELKEDAPLLTNLGNLIKDGVNNELDDLRKIAHSGKDILLEIQQREIKNTGISSLKIAYNKVFGYYLEVTHAHKDKVPSNWIRKQTLVNAERYITEELKVYEEKILTAEEKIAGIEQRIFQELVVFASDYIQQIQTNAKIVAKIDCLLAFALIAKKNHYVKPSIHNNLEVSIKEGRHPVIEQNLPLGESYIPNDIFLDDRSQQIMIITGPNMAGKSALLRQTALIVLMAQMGSFVPAKEAIVGIVDKVFTRVGASDNLSKGESTFMVEMMETASILNNLSDRSLVLMDEIGRGTSTYDGISIAWSIVEYLHNHKKFRPKTLFATHYHELNQLTNSLPRVKNFNVSVKEAGEKIIFMRKLKEGGSEHSFGIHVAQIAGMPQSVVLRADEIMHQLEKDKLTEKTRKKLEEIPKNTYQLSMFEADPKYENIKKILEQLDINTLSPVEALLKLNEIKLILENKNSTV